MKSNAICVYYKIHSCVGWLAQLIYSGATIYDNVLQKKATHTDTSLAFSGWKQSKRMWNLLWWCTTSWWWCDRINRNWEENYVFPSFPALKLRYHCISCCRRKYRRREEDQNVKRGKNECNMLFQVVGSFRRTECTVYDQVQWVGFKQMNEQEIGFPSFLPSPHVPALCLCGGN